MKKILVIEDNFEVRDNLCEILELSDYEVFAAENGKKGVEMAKKHVPDLIVCDVMMPELDGFGVLKILNQNTKLNHIPLIFLTAKAEKTDFRKGMGLGAVDYITKPFDDTELLEAIEMRLKKSEKISKISGDTDESVSSFFSEVKAQEQLEKISLDRELRHYKPKDLVFSEGQNARWLYFVVSGQVKVYHTNEIGKELIVQIFGEGSFFGYKALITNQQYTKSAACLKDTTLRLIPKDDFSTLINGNRDFSIQFIKMLSNRTEEAETAIIEMAYGTVRQKVAHALITFAQKTAKGQDNVSIAVSREDLASLAGTAKETLIRTLSDFKSEKLISIGSKSIVIPDLNQLKALLE